MAFVIFKLPFSEEIIYWNGVITSEEKDIEIDNNKKFLLGRFNRGSMVLNLIVQEEKLNEQIPYEKLKFHYQNKEIKNLNKEEFCQLITEAISCMDNSETLKKIVLSRAETSNTRINIIESFKSLCSKYPNAFVHLLSSETTGTWLGASPEKFIEINNNELSTVALAGTLFAGQEEWTKKEIIEQNWVEVHIENTMKELGINVSKTGPDSLEIGNLKHLITKYTSKVDSQININNVIDKLNPTSAVGGIPTGESTSYINKNENYNREFYSGIIGPYFNKNKIQLFVNLRCLQINNDGITQYAGAGITNQSIPEKEWEETKNKIEMTRGFLVKLNDY
ncbi:MAG: chorismate-binding protein [Bacteroidia bacterium]